jgi:hypothetical protein
MALDEYDVFLSYSRANGDRARAFRSILERNGVRCWMDDKIVSGDWAQQIGERISKVRQFVLLGSAEAYGSNNVFNELLEALDRGPDFVHHVIIEKAEMPERFRLNLRAVQRVDASESDSDAVIESKVVPALRERIALSDQEIQDRIRSRAMGLIPTAITERIASSILDSCESIFLGDLMTADHLRRLEQRFSLDKGKGDRIVAAFDPSEGVDGTASILLLTNGIAWHRHNYGNDVQKLEWRHIESAAPRFREHDGTWQLQVQLRYGKSHDLWVFCQTDAFAKATADLITAVALTAAPQTLETHQ